MGVREVIEVAVLDVILCVFLLYFVVHVYICGCMFKLYYCLEKKVSISIFLLVAQFCFCLQQALALHLTADSLQSCRHEGWNSIAKYLVEDVPLNLKLEDVKDVQGVLSVVFKSPPADLSKFIKWVAEVRRQEDGSLILSEEEKGRLAVKVCHTFFVFLFWIAIIPHCPFS